MHYGFIIPGGDVESIPALAAEAEAAGWDGVFIPDCISIETPDHPAGEWYDPWILLALMAARTQRVRLGTMLTPPSRRRPWKLARELVTLDQLSHGRMVLPVGLGAAEDDAGFSKVGEVMSLKERARILDESLDILDGLWRGQPFTYSGAHYHIEGMTLLPRPVQQPRIPIWVVGAWPRQKSMQRALRWDGIMPTKKDGSNSAMTPADIRAMRAYIAENRQATTPFDIVVEGETPGSDPEQAASHVRAWEEAGATWWLESMWGDGVTDADVRQRIKQGPPRP
jgi:alkanesulfonate monooxygenase SsuD/methylene tetrahydromethanopterin reductase-like flavin-dependent oxidoreductase (luciferase family)